MTEIELPFPVPLHACFLKRRGGGGVPTNRYRAYGEEAAWMIRLQKAQPVKGPVSIRIELVAPDRRARDADNLGKCVFDTLTKNSIIEDDSNRIVKRHSFEWVLSGPPCRVLIREYQGEGLL